MIIITYSSRFGKKTKSENNYWNKPIKPNVNNVSTLDDYALIGGSYEARITLRKNGRKVGEVPINQINLEALRNAGMIGKGERAPFKSYEKPKRKV